MFTSVCFVFHTFFRSFQDFLLKYLYYMRGIIKNLWGMITKKGMNNHGIS
jgi:hypothetical protein